VAHLVADWLLQNDWMALNKTSLRHPAAWTHAAIHGVCLGLARGWIGGLVLAVVHLWVDTRVPVGWWLRNFKKCTGAPDFRTIAMLTDQVVHIVCLAAWVAFAPA
jgi:hypothetical protein